MPESRRRDRSRDPSTGGVATRGRPDACPGAWRRHDAADGALARFRLVGGAVTAAELAILAGASVDGGSPLELTSRGSVQVRALAASTADDLADALRGLPPGPLAVLDERGRDLPCSLAVSPRTTALDDAAAEVAAGLRERAGVPGRLLVALDDGSGDVAGLGADVAVITRSAHPSGGSDASSLPTSGSDDAYLPTRDDHGGHGPSQRAHERPSAALLLDGVDTGLRHPDAAALALAAVDGFLAARGDRWRLAELPDGPAVVAAAVRERLDVTDGNPHRPVPPGPRGPGVGDDGVLEALPRLGELDVRAAGALVRALTATGATLRVTPWRTVVLRGLPDPHATAEALDAAGLETAPTTPWAGLSACVGAPRCAKSHTDVRADLTAAVGTGRAGRGVVPAHWVGCARACGTPGGRVAVVEATPTGNYRTIVRAGRVAR